LSFDRLIRQLQDRYIVDFAFAVVVARSGWASASARSYSRREMGSHLYSGGVCAGSGYKTISRYPSAGDHLPKGRS